MSTATKTKSDRINLRLKSRAKSLLERAASFEGKTVSNFILTCAMERAEETIRNHETMVLNANNSETFINALSGPLKFNSKLADAIEEHSQRVTSK